MLVLSSFVVWVLIVESSDNASVWWSRIVVNFWPTNRFTSNAKEPWCRLRHKLCGRSKEGHLSSRVALYGEKWTMAERWGCPFPFTRNS
jgi:hypothetical protein